jgi:hypothetical protein
MWWNDGDIIRVETSDGIKVYQTCWAREREKIESEKRRLRAEAIQKHLEEKRNEEDDREARRDDRSRRGNR